LKTSKE